MLKYQLSTMWLVYASLILCYLFITVPSGFMAVEGRFKGLEMTAFLFAFIIFISGYGENARFFMQNSSTRKAVFWATMISLVINCAGLSLVTQIATLIGGLLSDSGETVFAGVSTVLYGIDQGLAGAIFTNTVFTFAVMMAFGMFGIFLAAVFFRLGKNGRVILAVFVPVFLFGVLPVMVAYLSRKAPDFMMAVSKFLYSILGFKSGNPYIGILTFVIGAAIMGVFVYLVNRRMEIK